MLYIGSSLPHSRKQLPFRHGDTEVSVKTHSAISKGRMGRRDHEFEGAQNHFVLVAEKKE